MTTLQERYREFKRATGTSDKLVAQNIGLSPTVISQWLNQKYTGDNAAVEIAISEYLDIQAASSSFGDLTLKFVPTSNAKRICGVIKRSQIDKNMSLVVGDSGLGKTFSVNGWVSKYHRTSILVNVNVTFNPKILMSELHRALGLGGHGSKNSMLKDCIAALRGTDRVVIIDEADLLGIASIELLRALHDEARIGVVMLGLPVLAEAIRGSRGELARINTRVVNFLRLESLTEEDAAAIIATMIPDGDEFVRTFMTLSKGNGRILGNLLKNVVRVHRETKHDITIGLIEKCAEMQHR